MKKIVSLLFAACVAVGAFAQDLIITRDGQRLEAKVLEVSNAEVKYKEFNNQDGATFILRADEINTVVFENGSVKVFNAPSQTQSQNQTLSQANDKQPAAAVEEPAVVEETLPQVPLFTMDDDIYYLGDRRFTEAEYLAFVQENCQPAYEAFMKGAKLRKTGWQLLASGLPILTAGIVLCGVGVGVGYEQGNKQLGDGLCIPGAILIGVGTGLSLGSIPCLIVGSVKKNNSYEVYNEDCAPKPTATLDFRLQTSQNGIGLAMRF
ncbi:MAG: hypothetical protein J6P74_09150 [Paludibacteraceae bacterium]|nr:hypothetical protein [Paludibacteraceae bacterium]